MRQKRTAQLSFFEPDPVDHPVADALEAISAWLDDHPELLEAVAADLGAESGSCCGRHGLSCETVLRCAVLKHCRLSQQSTRGPNHERPNGGDSPWWHGAGSAPKLVIYNAPGTRFVASFVGAPDKL